MRRVSTVENRSQEDLNADVFYIGWLEKSSGNLEAKLTSGWEGLGDVLGQRRGCVLLLAG